MPLMPLKFRPGINRDLTSYADEGGWYECDRVRFRQGFPEQIGGWAKYSTYTYTGVCRSMFGWVTSYSDNLLALGTHLKAYIESGGSIYDITPLRETTAAGDVTFSATNGSNVITVTDTGSNTAVGDYVTFSGAVSLGGAITAAILNDEHIVTNAISANSYEITVGATATAADTGNGGAAVIGYYQVYVGTAYATYGYGWATSGWGRGTWGSGANPPLVLLGRYWWFDNFDNDLVFCYNDGFVGEPYIWERGVIGNPTTALGNRGVPLSSLAGASDVPDQVGQLLVSQNDKHLLAFGATVYGGSDYDPLLIRWANQDDPANWTPEVTNSAGFIRISRGSIIKRALSTRQEILVWTDTGLHSLQFTGTTDVFSLQELNNNISLMGPRAIATANNVVFWMGHDKFYAYTGRVESLPSTLQKHVFENFNHAGHEQVVAGTNEGHNEIWWFYPSATSAENDSYVVYNYVERVWYYGSLARTAWLDSGLREYPQGVYNGYIYNHEDGINADGAAINSYIESAVFDLGDGDQFMMTRRMLPDVNFSGSTAANPEVTLQLKTRSFPGNGLTSEGSERVISTAANVHTPQVFMRGRGRSAAIRVASTTTDTKWQLGIPRLDARPDGKR